MRYEPSETAPHSVAALAALQAVAAMAITSTLIPSFLGRYANLSPTQISWMLFAALISGAVIALLQGFRIGRLGAGMVMLGGTSPAFVGVAGFALVSGGTSLLTLLILCSAPAVFVFARYTHLIRKVLSPAVTGTIIMLVASSLAQVVWQISRQSDPSVVSLTQSVSPLLFSLTFCSIVLSALLLGPRFRLWAPLVGLGVGLLVSTIVGGGASFDTSNLAWFGMPGIALPEIVMPPLSSFIILLPSFLILQIIVSMETYSCAKLATSLYYREPDNFDQRSGQGGVLANGLGTLVAALVGGLPTTTYSSTVSLLGLNGVASRRVGYWAAGLLVLMAFSPFFLFLLTSIPPSVAAAYLLFIVVLMFGNGMRMATEGGLEAREGIAVLSGFWIGLSLQAGAFASHFGEAATTVRSAGTSLGGLVTLLLVLLMRLNDQGQMRFALKNGCAELPSIIGPFTSIRQLDRESSSLLLLACEEALRIILAVAPAADFPSGARQVQLTLWDAGDHCRVEFVTMPSGSNLEALRRRASVPLSYQAPDEALELAGMRILLATTRNLTRSRFQDVEILSFEVPLRKNRPEATV